MAITERTYDLDDFALVVARARGGPRIAGHAAGEPPVLARIDHGRAIADCPFCEGGAEDVCRRDPRFYCLSCFNAGAANRTLAVVFPPDFAELAAALERRPRPSTMHWRSGETLEDLLAENVENGVG